MDLRDILSRNKGQEFLWSLVVEPGWVQAGIWTIDGGAAKVISVSSPVAWEKDEELVTASDTALSSAVQALPEDAGEPSKVVFGVSASWVENGQIKAERLELLRTVCSKLTLKPSGFVTLPEAISFYIKSKEGSPLTAVVVSPGKELLEVSVFRLGNLLGTTQVARSVSLFEDVLEALSRFNLQDPVPSRFILFDGKEGELEEAKQAILEGAWETATKVKILHTPKVEILGSREKVEAVSLGGATEMGGPGVTAVTLSSEAELSEAANVGFVVDKDINEVREEEAASLDDGSEELVDTPPSLKPKRDLGAVFTKRLEFAAPFVQKVKAFAGGGKKPVLLGGGAFLLVFVALLAFWWFYPKATVTIFVAPQKLDEKVTLLVDTKASDVDFDKKTLPGRVGAEESKGDKTVSTTGNKLVGEKAKGEVEIRNGRADDLDLDTGTLLIASNGLEFELEKSATIPAQTAPGDPGVGKIQVVASDIGSEYNLAKDERFKVGNFPKAEVDAVVTGDFTGGASRQIQAVSQEDRDRVLEELTAELEEKAKDALKTSVSATEFFVDGSTITTVLSQNYSGKVGDEADSLKLTLDVNVDGVVVSKENLFNLAREVLKEKIPDGYILRETQIEYEFELKEKDKDEADSGVHELEGSVSANLLPEINTDEVANAIVGKYPPLAQEFLTKIPGFVRAQISISPRFPGRLGTLPRVKKNISVEIAAER